MKKLLSNRVVAAVACLPFLMVACSGAGGADGEAEKTILGNWRIDIEATKALPAYAGEDVSYLDTWNTDSSTLIRIEAERMHFWDKDWTYQVLASRPGTTTAQLLDTTDQTTVRSTFTFVDDGLLFEFMQGTPYVLQPAVPAL